MATLVRKDLTCSEIVLNESANIEIVIVSVKCHNSMFNIANCYRPSVIDVNFLHPLKEVLSSLSRRDVPIIFTGDLNLPDVDWENHHAPNLYSQDKFVQCFDSFGLSQKVQEPTRENNILDLVLVNEPFSVLNVSVLPPLSGSDHNCVSFEINVPTCPRSNPVAHGSSVYARYNWDKANIDGIRNALEFCDWSSVIGGTDSDEMYNNFCSFCHQIFESFVPLKPPPIMLKRKPVPKELKNIFSKKLAPSQR